MIKIRRLIFGMITLIARVLIASAVANTFEKSFLILIPLLFWVFFPTWSLAEAMYWDYKYIKQEQDKAQSRRKVKSK